LESFIKLLFKIGGTIKKGHKVLEFKKEKNNWNIKTGKGYFKAKKIINSLPIDLLQTICPDSIKNKLQPFIVKNERNKGSAIVIFRSTGNGSF
jgi:protoporphyrinogen oxidase